ncbi:MAG: hypothetical protein M3270_06675 [Thermoproteota archaeon]|nr:hypothetical protein [Thermoproteota archaeon]
MSDLKGFPHFSHTNDWVILMRALVISPLSGVGPMLDADILLVWSIIQFISYSRKVFGKGSLCLHNKAHIAERQVRLKGVSERVMLLRTAELDRPQIDPLGQRIEFFNVIIRTIRLDGSILHVHEIYHFHQTTSITQAASNTTIFGTMTATLTEDSSIEKGSSYNRT